MNDAWLHEAFWTAQQEDPESEESYLVPIRKCWSIGNLKTLEGIAILPDDNGEKARLMASAPILYLVLRICLKAMKAILASKTTGQEKLLNQTIRTIELALRGAQDGLDNALVETLDLKGCETPHDVSDAVGNYLRNGLDSEAD